MPDPLPGWVGPTAAISLVVIALSFIAIAAALGLTAWTARRQLTELGAKLETIRADFQRVLESARRVTEGAAGEAQHYLATSRAIRQDLERGVRRVKTRLAELDALYEVVHAEVQDTALDVAARVRSIRRGVGVAGRLRRMIRGRRRA